MTYTGIASCRRPLLYEAVSASAELEAVKVCLDTFHVKGNVFPELGEWSSRKVPAVLLVWSGQ